MAVSRSSHVRLPQTGLLLNILLAFASAVAAQGQSSDEPPLGDVARTQHSKKTAANVIDNDEMVRRGFPNSSGNVLFECDPECRLKARALSSYEFRHATEKQFQDAFAVAVADLAQDDWGHRLAEIREEVCRNPGDLDSKPLRALENEMFSKLRLEERAKEAGHPDDVTGIERQLELRTDILEAKIELFQHACSSTPKVPAK